MLKAVLQGGSGSAVVLLHGFAADRHAWVTTVSAFRNVSSVWTMDLPAHGDAWQVPVTDSLDALSLSLQTAVFDVSAEPIHLVGHSLGGALALKLFESNPARTASLTLIAPVGLGRGIDIDYLRRFTELNDVESVLVQLRHLVVNPRLIAAPLATRLLTHLNRPGVRERWVALVDVIERSRPSMQRALDALLGSDLPRLVIWGRDDQVNPCRLDDQQPFAGSWHVLPDCGHLPHIEQRVAVNRLLTGFLLTVQGD